MAMCLGPLPGATSICPWILKLPGAPSLTSRQILSAPCKVGEYKDWVQKIKVAHEIRDEDLSVGLERHMRIRRATVHRELDDRRLLLEMKRVSRDGSDQGAVRRSKLFCLLLVPLQERCRKVLTFMPVTSPVLKGFVKVGPFPPVETVSTNVSPPSEPTTKD